MNDSPMLEHARRMLSGLCRVSGYVDDVVKWLLTIARHDPEGFAVVEYQGQILCATGSCSHAEIIRTYERTAVSAMPSKMLVL